MENDPHAGGVEPAPVAQFDAMVFIQDHPGELKPGYTPVAFVRTGRSAVRLKKINWKVGKETGGQKLKDPVPAS